MSLTVVLILPRRSRFPVAADLVWFVEIAGLMSLGLAAGALLLMLLFSGVMFRRTGGCSGRESVLGGLVYPSAWGLG